jgi:acetyltransferase
MDISEVDTLDYLINDPLTRTIGIHTESISGDGREFFHLVQKARNEGKRVVIIKTGRTSAGAMAAASHTGALVQGSDAVFDGALKQAGAIRVNTIESFFHVTRALDRFGELSPSGNRVAIAMLPGGLGVMVTDLCERSGLKMAKVGSNAIEKLKHVYPGWEIKPNPWDLGVTMQFNNPVSVYETWIEAMMEDPNVDMLAFQIHQSMLMLGKDFFKVLVRPVKAGKPTCIWIYDKESGTNDLLKWVEDQGVPVFRFPEKAIQGLVALYQLTRAPGSGTPLRRSGV